MSGTTQILDLNRYDPATGGGSALLQARQRHAGASSVLFYADPIEMVRGEGVWLTAADGRRYLDVYNNVPSVGHCHPKVVEAIARQASAVPGRAAASTPSPAATRAGPWSALPTVLKCWAAR